MSCDCPTAPLLSGPGFANLDKFAADQTVVEVEWCPSIPEGATVSDAGWVAQPSTTTPLFVAGLTPVGTRTSATISGGSPGQLYRVTDNITAQVLPDGPIQDLTFVIWVYIPQDNTPAVFVPCEE